ncbi:MAG: hypothetical protein WC548_02710 [Candidatus Pacearchaeota archaeon]
MREESSLLCIEKLKRMMTKKNVGEKVAFEVDEKKMQFVYLGMMPPIDTRAVPNMYLFISPDGNYAVELDGTEIDFRQDEDVIIKAVPWRDFRRGIIGAIDDQFFELYVDDRLRRLAVA